MESRIAHILTTPIQVAVNGNLEDVQVVDLVAPTKKMLRKTYKLQQYITQALISSQSLFKGLAQEGDAAGASDESESEFDKKAVMAILLASDVDVDACFNEFEKLALLGSVEVNGAVINRIQLDKIDPSDLEGMFAEYVANFTMSSVMGTFTSS